MKKPSKLLLAAGLVLVAVSVGLVVFELISMAVSINRVTTITAQLEAMLPPDTAGVTEANTTAEMPALELDGEDIVAVLEIPAYQVRLPVGSAWDATAVPSYPRRFFGTVYNGSLVVGGSDRRGQLACSKRLDIGDTVTVTDMSGAVFAYAVEKVERAKTATVGSLVDDEADLTLFVRDTFSLDYILIRCKLS